MGWILAGEVLFCPWTGGQWAVPVMVEVGVAGAPRSVRWSGRPPHAEPAGCLGPEVPCLGTYPTAVLPKLFGEGPDFI